MATSLALPLYIGISKFDLPLCASKRLIATQGIDLCKVPKIEAQRSIAGARIGKRCCLLQRDDQSTYIMRGC
jgi:hypothetical protein